MLDRKKSKQSQLLARFKPPKLDFNEAVNTKINKRVNKKMAEKTKLLTQFLTVATAGPTIDGRTIEEQDLIDITETYDPSEYTALIDWEHFKSMNYLGSVEAVQLGKDGKGRVTLEAQLAPTEYAIRMNKSGDAQFTSIEIQPNYANTGKTALTGLALTNSPASLGTNRLQFSDKDKAEKYSKSHQIGVFTLEEDTPQTYDEASALAWFRKKFGIHTPPDETEQEPHDMNEEQQANLVKALGAAFSTAIDPLATAIREQGEELQKFTANQGEQTPPEGDTAGAEGSADDNGDEDLSAKFSELEAKHEALQKQFAKVTGEAHGETPDGEDGEDKTMEGVI